MMKNCWLLYLTIQLGCTAILALATPPVLAQDLLAIPKEWPINYQNDLLPRKELVEKHFKEFDLKIDKYNAKCGDGKIPANDNALKAFCARWSDELDIESLALDKEKENFMAKFNDYDMIYKVFMQSKEFQKKEEERIRKIAPLINADSIKGGTHPFGEKIAENPDLNDINVDLSVNWGGSTGIPPTIPGNLIRDKAIELKLAKKYPAFNEILKKENKLKDHESKLKKEVVTLHQEIKGKGSTATKEDLDKLAVITNNLKKIDEDLKKVTVEKEKAKKDYKVKDTF